MVFAARHPAPETAGAHAAASAWAQTPELVWVRAIPTARHAAADQPSLSFTPSHTAAINDHRVEPEAQTFAGTWTGAPSGGQSHAQPSHGPLHAPSSNAHSPAHTTNGGTPLAIQRATPSAGGFPIHHTFTTTTPTNRTATNRVPVQRFGEYGSGASSSGERPPRDIDYQALAQQVYRRLKQRLLVERERAGVYRVARS